MGICLHSVLSPVQLLLPSGMPPAASLSSLRLVARDIKLSHSVFALPFAVLAACIARPADAPWPRFAGQLGLVVVCMVAARSWAMMVNRLADASIDAKNPRTARRVFASGELSTPKGWLIASGFAAAFVASASLFGLLMDNWWPAVLAIPVLLWIALYSWTKRFTWLCHVFLGGALAASPLAAALAVDPGAVGLWPLTGPALQVASHPAVWWLAGMVLTWVAGFDIIYALQDVDFDRREGLFSLPASLGPGVAMWISRALHVAAAAMLWMAMRSDPRFGPIFMAGVFVAWGLLIMEHLVLLRRGMAGLDMAFFTLNGIVSCALGLAGCIDLVK